MALHITSKKTQDSAPMVQGSVPIMVPCRATRAARAARAAAIVLAVALVLCAACCLGGCSCASDDGQAKTTARSISDKKLSTNKPIAKVEEKAGENDSRVFTYYFEDGTTETVTVTKDEMEGSGVSEAGDRSSGESTSQAQAGTPEGSGTSEYEQFMAKSDDEKYAVFQTFDSPQDFLDWFNGIKDEYQKAHPAIPIGPGDVVNL